MPKPFLNDKAAISGIGQTDLGHSLGRSTLDMACEAVLRAVADAGLKPSDIDGVVRYSMQEELEDSLQQAMGIGEITYYADQPHGGASYSGVVMSAALGVAAGLCNHAVAFRSRARGRRSALAAGMDQGGRPWEKQGARLPDARQFHTPFGIMSPVQEMALISQRYMHEYGVTEDHLANVAIALRNHAIRNPGSVMGPRGPITHEDHHQSRMIADPLRLLDCCIETDGAVAIVVSRTEEARNMRQPPAIVHAAAQHTQPAHYNLTEWWRWRRDDMALLLGQRLWQNADVGPEDINAVMLYDHFTSMTLLALEDLVFCGRGEAGAFSEGGNLEGPDGRLPVNTHGGSLSEGWVHGFNAVPEAVRQVRGHPRRRSLARRPWSYPQPAATRPEPLSSDETDTPAGSDAAPTNA